MSLRDALRRAEERRPPPPRLAPPALAKTAKELQGRWDGTVEPGADPRRWDAITRRDWRWLPWALWHGTPPLAADERLLGVYEHRLRAEPRRSEVKALISAYLRELAPGKPGLERVARLLAELAPAWDWPWRERHARLRLFDPAQAPGRLADLALGHSDGVAAALAEAGIDGYHHLGLPLQALLAAIGRLEARLASGETAGTLVERVLDWCLVEEGGIAPSARGPLADALLRPWATWAPSADLKARIQSFLLQHYRDPRVAPRNWLGVSEPAQAVFKKWLVKVALDQFLEVVDRFALDHQWRYRRAFWMAYFNRDWISEAHVMFGRRGYDAARRAFGREVPCARLESAGKRVEPEHAVLLMRIGRLVVADWSHNGRCALWEERRRDAPVFARTSYTSADVDADRADHAIRHAGSEYYSWQRAVRDTIGERTTLWLADREFSLQGR